MKVVIDIAEETYANAKSIGLFLCPSDKNKLEKAIKYAIPYEERPQGEWVPVSKELPNKNGWYICTCEGICNRTVGVVGYDAIQKKWGRGGVIAWQPLPEPYEEN